MAGVAPLELPPDEAYALWAASYEARPHTPLMEIEQAALLALLPEVAGRRCLDLGCGSGRYLALLSQRGGRAVGCDLSAPMLARASTLGLPLALGDLRATPFQARAFDAVVCGLALGDVAELGAALREIARVLAPGGVLVASDLHPDGARTGWRRTFRSADGRLLAVRHHVHAAQDYGRACAEAGLGVERLAEPKVEFEHAWRGRPAALVIRARRG
jgi:malonyl-CoA O-methyltransferase